MAEVDISSYPKMPVAQQQNPLDTISKIQGIQQQGLTIDRQKLENYDKQYDIVHRTLGNLVNDPDASIEDAYKDLMKRGVMTSEQYADAITKVPTRAFSKSDEDYKQRVQKYKEIQLLQAQEKHEVLNNYFGRTVDKDVGNQTAFGNEGAIRPTGRGTGPSTFTQTGNSLVRQPAAGTPAVDEKNNAIFNRPRPPQYITPGGAVQSAPLPPVSGGPANKLPIAAPQAEGGADRPAPPTGFAEGMKGKTEDQLKGKGLSIQNVTALQAYKLIQGLRSGPTTGPWNEAVAALKANHIIPIEANDPTAIYEEANKKLSQIVQAGGQRSDAALAKSEESSPSVKTQISPALIKLTRDLIGNNRTNIVMPNEFEGNDLQNYNKHASTFATKVDQVAASYDLLPKDEKVKIWKAMKEKKDTKEGKRFFDTLRIMRKHDQFDPESLGQ